MARTAPLDIADCVNQVCPWSGRPVAAEGLTRYRGEVVGFCDSACRDRFQRAVAMFDAALNGRRNGEG